MASPLTSQVVVNAEVKTVVFRSDETGYTVASALLDGKNYPVNIVGSFVSIYPDESFELTGSWTNHPRYGLQFKVDHYRRLQPQTTGQIYNYLSSGAVKGIGPALAERIVKRFGDQTLVVLKNEPDKLATIPGIGKARARSISESAKQNEASEKAMVFLRGHEIGAGTSAKIIARYGDKTIEAITENPYQLVDDIFGIGFLKADEIARRTGIPANSRFRIRAALSFVLQQAVQAGHVYLTRKELLHGSRSFKGAVELLGVDANHVERELESMIASDALVLDEDRVYLPAYYDAEVFAANKLIALARGAKQVRKDSLHDQIARFEKKAGITLADKQREAVHKAFEHGVILLTGGPGTGKTTTLNALIHLLRANGLHVELAAPTGRAAKRMSEATGSDAQTIHRLLGYKVNENTGRMHFEKNAQNPIDADVVVVDEVSMVDIMLLEKLLKAIRPQTRVIFVGDKDQLPSVGAGNVMADLIASDAIHCIVLNVIFRQAQESKIIQNAHRINAGEFPYLSKEISLDEDFWFCEAETNGEIIAQLKWLYHFHLQDFDPIRDVQVLTPMRRTDVGIEALNEMLQEMLNPAGPSKEELKVGKVIYRQGDKVMVQRNNYDKEVFNGDIGIVVSVNKADRKLTLEMSDDRRRVELEGDELLQISLSYACSIHKSQGSEWPCVIVVSSTSHAIMLQRNLLYTAITRAKKQVILVGSKKAIGMSVRNNRVQLRNTRLAQRLAVHRPTPVVSVSTRRNLAPTSTEVRQQQLFA